MDTALLYEMLAGRRAFGAASDAGSARPSAPGGAGGDVMETLAVVLKGDVDWSLLPSGTPASVRRLLRRCLEKDQTRRLRDIGDAKLDLDEGDAPEAAENAGDSETVRRLRRERLVLAAVAGVLLALTAMLGVLTLRAPAPVALPETRLELTVPPSIGAFQLSPDARSVVYVARVDGHDRLVVRSLEDLSTRVLRAPKEPRDCSGHLTRGRSHSGRPAG
jgi:hypothetical protein